MLDVALEPGRGRHEGARRDDPQRRSLTVHADLGEAGIKELRAEAATQHLLDRRAAGVPADVDRCRRGGAVAGGFAVGVIENLAGTFIPYVGRELKLTIALVLIVAVLMVKPSGVFGRTVVSRV